MQSMRGLRPVRASHGGPRLTPLTGRPTAAVNLADMAAASKLVKPKQGLSSRVPLHEPLHAAVTSPRITPLGQNPAWPTAAARVEPVPGAVIAVSKTPRPESVRSTMINSNGVTSEPGSSTPVRLSKRLQIERTEEQLAVALPVRLIPGPLHAVLSSNRMVKAPSVAASQLSTSSTSSESDDSGDNVIIAATSTSRLPAAAAPKSSLQQFIMYSQKEHRKLLEGNGSGQPKKQRKRKVSLDNGFGVVDSGSRLQAVPLSLTTSIQDALENRSVPLNTVKISLGAVTAMERAHEQQARLREEQELKQVMSTAYDGPIDSATLWAFQSTRFLVFVGFVVAVEPELLHSTVWGAPFASSAIQVEICGSQAPVFPYYKLTALYYQRIMRCGKIQQAVQP